MRTNLKPWLGAMILLVLLHSAASSATLRKIYLPFAAQPGAPTPTPIPTATARPPSPPEPTSAPPTAPPSNPAGLPRVNAPFFKEGINFRETAIFWFGRVNSSENYADVRVGYNQQELWVHVAAFDRYLWYDRSPVAAGLAEWDAASLYLEMQPTSPSGLSASSYRFVAQLSHDQPRSGYQAVYRGGNSGWEPAGASFTTEIQWRGSGPNDNEGSDRGWAVTYHIPWSSLGLSGPPVAGALRRLAVTLHDRDGSSGPALASKSWLPTMDPDRPATWGELHFGLPGFAAPGVSPAGTVKIRHKLDGAQVVDGEVGGSTTCGKGLDFWTQWGDHTTPGSETNADFNVQNQYDVADWPCYAKFYLSFPLDRIPVGKVIVSARLTLHQFGGSGGGEWGEPQPSLIQVFTVNGGWQESSLTWNNAPLARENVSAAWVNPLTTFPGWPGVPWTWDLSRAVAAAYAAGGPLHLAVYSADGPYHSGKYFSSSDTADWNARARPTLEIEWGNP